MTCASIWRWLTTSRYTRTLEEEVARLRAENRALVNSLLGTAGVPPLQTETGTPGGREAGKTAAPIRRRSWQQIGRMLEIEEARLAAQPHRTAQIERERESAPRTAETHGVAAPPTAPAGRDPAKPCGKLNGSGS